MVASKHKTREDRLHVNLFLQNNFRQDYRKAEVNNRQFFVQTIAKKQQMLHQEY